LNAELSNRLNSMGRWADRVDTYTGTVQISRIVDSTKACRINGEINHHLGWIVRNLIDVAPEKRALYDAHIAEEEKDAADMMHQKRLAAERMVHRLIQQETSVTRPTRGVAGFAGLQQDLLILHPADLL
jgi:hypothetical protein